MAGAEDNVGQRAQERRKVCPKCRGGGRIRTEPTKVEPCDGCDGTGYVEKEGWES